MAMMLPRFFIKDYGMLPLRVAGNRILYLGFRDRLDASLTFATERMSGLRIESGVVAEAEFEAARRRLLECEFPETYGKAVSDGDALAERIAAILEQRQGGWCGCTSTTGCACGRRQVPGALWAALRCGWRI
jgi:hypothetical protein